MKIFVDTSAFVALNNKNEPNHIVADALLGQLDLSTTILLTSNYTIAETITILSQRISKEIAINFKELDVPTLEVIWVNEMIEAAAFDIFKKIKSKNVSFIDCTSFALMRELGIKTVFTFDRDFKKQGFSLLE